MKILAIDTGSKVATAGICQDGKLLGEYTINNGLTHSQGLLPMIDNLLVTLNLTLKDIDAFAVSTGPGSFTGLRIGIATIKGFAFSENKPCIEVSSLEAMAYNHLYTNYIICPLMDARNNQVYNAIYKRENGKLKIIKEPRAIEMSKVIEDLKKLKGKVLFLGDGVTPNIDAVKSLKTRALISEFNNNMQRGASVALVAWEKAKAGQFVTGDSLSAEYLRKSQAEREREK
ncbi:MAG: tRNA (adenosine(37)-N6)-threonylcarbamoyltransferase complex dimerization subunit type 1 TsaB [Clostridia bacterium]|nr:tRNA (adenosine(37)-N6)-threonylcarbamoyltransferase complex dimerization subunit type 1 TsaB [Clostridia bacterium]